MIVWCAASMTDNGHVIYNSPSIRIPIFFFLTLYDMIVKLKIWFIVQTIDLGILKLNSNENWWNSTEYFIWNHFQTEWLKKNCNGSWKKRIKYIAKVWKQSSFCILYIVFCLVRFIILVVSLALHLLWMCMCRKRIFSLILNISIFFYCVLSFLVIGENSAVEWSRMIVGRFCCKQFSTDYWVEKVLRQLSTFV